MKPKKETKREELFRILSMLREGLVLIGDL